MRYLNTDDLLELGDLTRLVIKNSTTPARLTEIESRGDVTDAALWNELAQAGVSSVALPVEVGGMGFGLSAIAAVVYEQGARVAPVPLWTSMIAHRFLATTCIDTFMTQLESAATGDMRTTLALDEGPGTDLLDPHVQATREGSGFRLTGTKVAVAHSDTATHVLVSARTAEGPAVFLVAADADGVQLTAATSTNRGRVARLDLTGARGVLVGDEAGESLRTLVRETRMALAAVLIGVARGALNLTTDYVSQREQFGRPIGSFQSLQHSLADASIGIDAAELVLAQALDEPSDDRAALVAIWWARTATEDTVYRCQHVHGGIGVDIDYPLHRYFLWGRQLALTFGNVEADLEELATQLITGVPQ